MRLIEDCSYQVESHLVPVSVINFSNSLGSDESSLMITDLTEDDSGSYECRIMVEQTVSVAHSLTVANIFSIHPDPADSQVNVPLRYKKYILQFNLILVLFNQR